MVKTPIVNCKELPEGAIGTIAASNGFGSATILVSINIDLERWHLVRGSEWIALSPTRAYMASTTSKRG
jgi:hypothetical protein